MQVEKTLPLLNFSTYLYETLCAAAVILCIHAHHGKWRSSQTLLWTSYRHVHRHGTATGIQIHTGVCSHQIAIAPKRNRFPQAGDLEGMRQYVEAGGNVKKRDFFNNTALHRSASMGFTVITGYLLESGAEVDAVAADGW